MNAKELMIGDWVWAEGVTKQVDAIRKNKIGVHFRKDRLRFLWENNVAPIAMTSGILEMNGFKKLESVRTDFGGLSPKQWTYENNECVIYVYENGVIYWMELELNEYAGKIELPFSFVHELQNAMNIFGISKKIEL